MTPTRPHVREPGDRPRLVDLVAMLADESPEAVALFDGHDAKEPASPVTRRDLMDRTVRLAAALADAGVGVGDAIGVWLPNWSTAVAAQLAASAVGAHVIGINTRYNADEVAHVVAGARPSVLIVPDVFDRVDLPKRLATALDIMDAAPEDMMVLVVPAPGATDVTDAARYAVPGLGADAVRAFAPSVDLQDLPGGSLVEGRLATAFTTSGSTGRPKLAAHTEAAVIDHSLAVGARMGFRPGDVFLGALPLSGVFGFNAAYAALLAGAATLLEPVFSADGAVADMADLGVTHIVGADDLIGRIAQAWENTRPSIPLRVVAYADFEGRSAELADWAEREFGAVAFGVYGSSELFALTTFWNDDDPVELRRSGGGRMSLPTAEVRIADPFTGEVLDDGQEGEIQFRGPNVVDEYLGDTDGSIAGDAVTEDGWFHSGDLGVLIEPRAVRYVCRMGDVLRLRGFLVDPAEIERRLLEHPEVQIAKVVGVSPEKGGAVAVGFVLAKEGCRPDPEALRAWCAETLASFKVPTRVVLVDEMPVTAGTNGTKIRAAALREQASALLGLT